VELKHPWKKIDEVFLWDNKIRVNMKIKYQILFINLFFLFNLQSQNVCQINYVRTEFWGKIVQRLPYLSKEEKDRSILTRGRDEGYKSKYILTFDSTQSFYTYEEESAAESNYGYSWRKEDYLIYKDFANKRKLSQIEELGKTYLIEEIYQRPKWKILNEIKDVAGYICMKAETTDTIKNHKITAWFTDALTLSTGPEEFDGLPGTILELIKNDGDVTITATSVILPKNPLPLKVPKMKGKKIISSKFNELIQKHIIESIEAQRNPYWSIRY
jgi:GLPGLI family protein